MHTGMIPFLKKWFGDLRSCCVTPDTWIEVLDEDDSIDETITRKEHENGKN